MRKLLTATPTVGLDRRLFLAGLGAGLIATPRAFAGPSSDHIGQRLAQTQQNGRVRGLHALLVSQGGTLVFEHYGQGDDESEMQGRLPGVAFGPDVPHDLRSVSKSVVALAYGIALAAGGVPPPEAKLYAQFPEYSDLAGQPGRDRLTVHHALSMTLGFDWDELIIPYGDPRNAENAMEAAPDRYRFILDRPIVREPGSRWSYCGGATALLGRLIAKGTGETLLDYCRRVLFDPMGFGPVAWSRGRLDGEYRAASGLRLLPHDLLKIGQLVQAGGVWEGRQLVPRDWMRRVLTPTIALEDGRRYGYQWYLGASALASPHPALWVGGIGWGGQRLYVFFAHDLVVVQYCGNYDLSGAQQNRVNEAIISEAVLPSFT